METHLGLAGGPAGCEAVETVTQDGSFKDSCLKEDQRTRALAGDGQGIRGGSTACVCHQWAQSREKQTLSLCGWVRGRDRAPTASVAGQLQDLGGACIEKEGQSDRPSCHILLLLQMLQCPVWTGTLANRADH